MSSKPESSNSYVFTRWQPYISAVATSVLIICAVVMTAMAIYQQFATQDVSEEVSAERSLSKSEWLTLSGSQKNSRGGAAQIVVFSDYECPFCRMAHSNLRRLQDDYGNDVTVDWRHFPLDSHENALEAAVAVECADLQGAFSMFSTALFNQQSSLSEDVIGDIAESVLTDTQLDSYRDCVAQDATLKIVEKDKEIGQRLGFRATPTLVINGDVVEGATSYDTLVSLVDRAQENGTSTTSVSF